VAPKSPGTAESARLTRADVERVAALAHLSLDEAEIERFAGQLTEILRYAAQIQAVDTTQVSPTAHPLTTAAWREDEPVQSLTRDEALANAPDAAPAAGLFRVPKVIG
jgi:aspartyl-tRNA(Asn)/glutamyl-tRNA(Gln) amidotransferase subunit C